jgi:hypothetical protein
MVRHLIIIIVIYFLLWIQPYKVYIIKAKINSQIIDQKLQSLNLDMCVHLIKIDGGSSLLACTEPQKYNNQSNQVYINFWI